MERQGAGIPFISAAFWQARINSVVLLHKVCEPGTNRHCSLSRWIRMPSSRNGCSVLLIPHKMIAGHETKHIFSFGGKLTNKSLFFRFGPAVDLNRRVAIRGESDWSVLATVQEDEWSEPPSQFAKSELVVIQQEIYRKKWSYFREADKWNKWIRKVWW